MSLNSPKHDPNKQRYGMEKPARRELSDTELAWLNGDIVYEPDTDTNTSNNDIDAGTKTTFIASNSAGTKSVISNIDITTAKLSNDNTIVIDNANRKVEVIFTGNSSNKQVTFSVTINNAAVDITDDGVSILMRNDLEIKPPTLVPMTIIVDNGTKYSVVYAGGKHRLGNFTNISFARIGDE